MVNSETRAVNWEFFDHLELQNGGRSDGGQAIKLPSYLTSQPAKMISVLASCKFEHANHVRVIIESVRWLF